MTDLTLSALVQSCGNASIPEGENLLFRSGSYAIWQLAAGEATFLAFRDGAATREQRNRKIYVAAEISW